MRRSLNRVLFLMLVVSTSVAVSTQAVGVLYPSESVFLNGTEIDRFRPVTSGDVIRTRERGTATLQVSRSVALIPPQSVVRIENGALALDTGTISMHTGKGVETVIPADISLGSPVTKRLMVQARDFKITPAFDDLTEFDVTRTNGLIAVTVRKNSVLMVCGAHKLRIEAGHQISRQDAACNSQ